MDVLNYAEKNGWKLIDSAEYAQILPKSWTYSGKQIFPYNFNESNNIGNRLNDELPRWIASDFELYIFKTGWVIFKPGTDESSLRTGFILISKDKRKITVYHLWGE